MAVRFGTGVVLQEEVESVQKRAARFVTGNYNYETGSMTGILGQLKWESLKKGEKTIDLYCYIKALKVKPVYQQMTLSPKLGTVEISTLWHLTLPLSIQVIQMFIKGKSYLAPRPRFGWHSRDWFTATLSRSLRWRFSGLFFFILIFAINIMKTLNFLVPSKIGFLSQ